MLYYFFRLVYPGYPMYYPMQNMQQFSPTQIAPSSVVSATSYPSGHNVYVGNLHPDTTETEVREAFQKYGPIQQIDMVKNKNCAFVKFVYPQNANTAHNSMKNARIHGQEIHVGWRKVEMLNIPGASPMPLSNQITKQMIVREFPSLPPSDTIWVGNVQPYFTEETIFNIFKQYGTIVSVKLHLQKVCFSFHVFIIIHTHSEMRVC